MGMVSAVSSSRGTLSATVQSWVRCRLKQGALDHSIACRARVRNVYFPERGRHSVPSIEVDRGNRSASTGDVVL